MRTISKLTTLLLIAAIFSASQVFAAFSHKVRGHNENCASCHKVPSGNWASSRGYPDVADYPGHASCLGCHRSDFFSGPKPAICAVCHSNPSPFNAGRFPFPLQSRKTQFETVFPHSVHQDIIALNLPQNVAPAHLLNAAYNSDEPKFLNLSYTPDEPKPAVVKPEFNSCAICHQTATKMPGYGNRKPKESLTLLTGTVVPIPEPTPAPLPGASPAVVKTPMPLQANFFKTMPQNHASCFNCHYQNQKPIRTDCKACHQMVAAYNDSPKILRYSLRFSHESENHNKSDCTICHIRITQNNDLKLMKDADVPFISCKSCHSADIEKEIAARETSVAEKKPATQCIYCHVTPIASYDIPASHK